MDFWNVFEEIHLIPHVLVDFGDFFESLIEVNISSTHMDSDGMGPTWHPPLTSMF